MQWPDQAKAQIASLTDVNHARLTRWYPNVTKGLGGVDNLATTLGVVMGPITEIDLEALGHAADTLHYRLREPALDEASVPELKDLVQAAIEAISTDSELPVEARLWLVGK